MGTWDSGPFDNDTAADWCGDLDDADGAKRPELVREALSRAAGADGYLDADAACQAIAAAAIVAAQQPGGQPITSPYAPDFLLDGGRLDLPDDLAVLAVRALDRVMAADSEWRDLWQEPAAGDVNPAFDAVRGLRRVLTA
ncbi:protein of unknown function [Micromonospora rhizosphaerae]|uniref:DUF4259 domain-containing protein n=1 Tax=Micromonospora rhizosphaerae TaxID=568872 RepID=A0A1C6T2Q9_9ACTN|nr:DUF4259 domain-containing protein [Micromonospora rhizosphaerae]SCL35919.1 protein of unknown function [Micromonospora rhizosphaerae]